MLRALTVVAAILVMLLIAMAVQRARMRVHQQPLAPPPASTR